MQRWWCLLLLPILANPANGQTYAPGAYSPPNPAVSGLVPPPATGEAVPLTGFGPMGFNANPSAGFGFNPYPSVTGAAAPTSSLPAVGIGSAPTFQPTPTWNNPSTWGFNNTPASSFPPPASAPPTSVFGTNNWNNTGFGGANSGWPVNTTNNPLSATADRLRQWLNPMQGSSAPGPVVPWTQQPPQYGNATFGGNQPQSFPFGVNPFSGGNVPPAPAVNPAAPINTWRSPPQPTSFRTTNPTGGAEPPIVIPPAALAGEIYAPSRRVREQPQPSVTQPTAINPSNNATNLSGPPPATYPQQQPAVRPQRTWLEMTDLPPVRRP